MVSFTILAGGFSTFIAGYVFNNVTSTLTLQGNYSSGKNPSWIIANANRCVLYAVNAIPEGAVQSYSINSDGSLSGPIATSRTEGSGPNYCAQLSNGVVAATNFGTGNGSFTLTTNDGKDFSSSSTFVTFPPLPFPNVSRPHMVLEFGEEVFVPDLAADQIWRLDKSTYQIHGSIPQPKGSGPRHIAIYNDRLFTIHEMSSDLSVQSIPDDPYDTSITYASVSIIPNDSPENATFAAAEILIPSTSNEFPKSYIYVSNRNTNPYAQDPRGDSIAIFEHVINNDEGQAKESLVLQNQIFTGLNQIRGMQIGNSDNGGDRYLIAGAAIGDKGVAVFQRTEGGRNLELVASNQEVPTRTAFVWS